MWLDQLLDVEGVEQETHREENRGEGTEPQGTLSKRAPK